MFILRSIPHRGTKEPHAWLAEGDDLVAVQARGGLTASRGQFDVLQGIVESHRCSQSDLFDVHFSFDLDLSLGQDVAADQPGVVQVGQRVDEGLAG